MENLAFVTFFQVAFCRVTALKILHHFRMCAEDEIIRIKLQHDAEGEPRPHAELLYIAFPVFQALILSDLNADQGGDLLLRQAQLDAACRMISCSRVIRLFTLLPPFSGW